ncbi:MAG: Nramp family divalent metal transporter [Proteobacteria bacterium]|nr:Nramp family divalent metal transporter [Pseudomonadota bacterium]
MSERAALGIKLPPAAAAGTAAPLGIWAPLADSADARPAVPSLAEVYRSIPVARDAPFWRRAIAFAGPGYLVAVGYMDPGNWATDIAGGSAFGYTLLSAVLLASLLAILFQALAAKLGIATGLDLAQACRRHYSRPVAHALWLLAETAICATDLAEVIGTAVALNLLFGIPILAGVVITALDVLLILALQARGFRHLEAFVMTLLVIIAGCFAFQVALSRPDLAALFGGFLPSAEVVRNPAMLYIAIGILGATVMPHNLYLHSAIVQTRGFEESERGRRDAIRLATVDSTIALSLALVINASILIVAAAAFHAAGQTEVTEIHQAYGMLAPLLGVPAAATAFAVALLAAGQNSTVTGTLAGQVVMEGFLDIRLPPWLRRLVTRAIAIVPAVAVTALYGESGTAKLLILSQVVLSLQLPFAVVPLVLFTSDRAKMGRFVNRRWLALLAFAAASVIIALNVKLVADFAGAL